MLTPVEGRFGRRLRQTGAVRALRSTLLTSLAIVALAACGADSSGGAPSDLDLSPDGQVGWQLAREQGCASCHGTSGEGKVGPAFAGLYGSEVALQDGTTVVADDEYLIRAIKDPNADKVEGYNLPMPSNSLSDAEIESILAYLRDLGDAG